MGRSVFIWGSVFEARATKVIYERGRDIKSFNIKNILQLVFDIRLVSNIRKMVI